MPTTRIPKQLEHLVRERAKYRCEYCQTSEWLTGQSCEIDHVLPRAHGGHTAAENLCLACSVCNGYKLDRTEAIDPETGETAALFNPREQQWHEHFEWSEDGTYIRGLSVTGRATVNLLKMNRPLAVSARALWVSIGRHPPG